MLRGTKVVLASAVMAIGLLAGASGVSADHAGETATSDTTEGLTDGQTITISVANMKMPGMNTAQIMMANTWPVKGPEAFNLAEFGDAPTVPINADGTGTFDYTVKVDHGTFNCMDTQCYVVIFQGMGFDAYTAGLPIKFGEAAPATEAPAMTEAPATEAPTTEPMVVAPAPEENSGGDSGGGSAGLIIGIVAAVVVLGGAGAVLAKRRKG